MSDRMSIHKGRITHTDEVVDSRKFVRINGLKVVIPSSISGEQLARY